MTASAQPPERLSLQGPGRRRRRGAGPRRNVQGNGHEKAGQVETEALHGSNAGRRPAGHQACHDGPLGGRFGRAKTGSLVRRLAFWVCQDFDVAEYVRSRQTCQRAKAEHGGPRSSIPCRCRRGAAG